MNWIKHLLESDDYESLQLGWNLCNYDLEKVNNLFGIDEGYIFYAFDCDPGKLMRTTDIRHFTIPVKEYKFKLL